MTPIRAATRTSPLARIQTELVAGWLAATGARVVAVPVTTEGDRRAAEPIASLGGQGVFVAEVQAAVLEGRADIAVHSAKDLPSSPTPGLIIAAICDRGDPRDGLVGSTLAGLGPGARVATGSVRRRAQLAHLRPDLVFYPLRGNMGTRLAQAGEFDAIVVAVAAMKRLEWEDRLAEALDPLVMVPQVGQGALAVECRVDDLGTQARLVTLDHRASRRAVEAERAFLAEVGGGCSVPVGAWARPAADPTGASLTEPGRDSGAERSNEAPGGGAWGVAGNPAGVRTGVSGRGTGHAKVDLVMEAVVATEDGSRLLRHRARGADPVALGRSVARHILGPAGGAELLGAGLRDLGSPDRGPRDFGSPGSGSSDFGSSTPGQGPPSGERP
ncbi:MAG: hydroxymethylbilane synthase [Acidimicrobiales bacterium]